MSGPTHVHVATAVALAAGAVAVALLIQHDVTQTDSTVGSGTAVTVQRLVPSFRAVEVAGETAVTVHVGGRRSVAVRADDNLLGNVSTKVESGVLVVRSVGSFTTRAPMTVEISVPALTATTLSGTGKVVIDGVRGAAFSARLPGTGSIAVGGEVAKVTATLSGTGLIDLSQLSSWDAWATLPGSGEITLNATHALHARLDGTGAIHYGGNPMVVDEDVGGTGVVAPLAL